MAVSLISRPVGHKLGTTLYNVSISDSGGDAIVTHSSGVANGSWVYLDGNIERYNGFKYVVQVSPTTFKFRNSIGGDEVSFIQEADAVMQISTLEHAWQSVHLPIAYELESDIFPLNKPDLLIGRIVNSFSNYNGQVELGLNWPLDEWDDLEYIELIGTGPLAGVYQITHGIDDQHVVIALAYDGSFSFAPYTVVNYFNNYYIEVYVYGGLSALHRWNAQDPLRIAATLRLIPDENNQVKFSISEIIKGFIKTRNNLTLDTLPNNLDFYTEFNIEYRQVYDEAVAGEIVEFRDSLVVDSLIGNAVNSMMPFKSLNQGFMSDYLIGESLSRWLTLLDRPVAVVGHFFDLSFLLTADSDINVTIFKGVGGVTTSTEIIEIDNPGIGVIRIPFVPESGYDLYCISVSSLPVSESLTLNSFANTGSGVSWTTGATPSVALTSSQDSKILFIAFPFLIGSGYTISATINYNVTAIFGFADLGVYDSSNNLLYGSNAVLSGSGSYTLSLSFTGVAGAARIGLTGHNLVSGGTSITVTNVSIATNAREITEQICIDIIEECGTTFTNDNLRITEDGYFRELE